MAVLELGSLLLALSLTLAWAPGLSGSAPPAQGLVSAVILLFACAIAFQYFDLYNVRTVHTWGKFTPRFAASVPMALIITSVGWALLPHDSAPAPLYLALLLVTFGLLVPARALTFTLLRTRFFDKRVLLIGDGPLADRIVREMAGAKGYSIVGQWLRGSASSPNGLSPAEQQELLARLKRLISEVRPNVVVVALHERRGHVPTQALLGARIGGAHVVEGAEFYEEVARKLAIENMQPSSLIFCTKLSKSRTRLFLHRAFSFGLAAFAVIVTAPLMAAIAILIKLNSEGPVLFVQPRVGRGGRLFPLFKFRTMRGKPRPGEDIWHRHDDGRITPMGSLLRQTHIDELPQLFNVIAGHMNLVGPRPEIADNVPTMSIEIPYYLLRHMVRPGITGWAQVRQGYAMTYEEVLEKTCYDLYYVKNMSIAFDARILLETARVLLSGQAWRSRRSPATASSASSAAGAWGLSTRPRR